MACYKFGVCRNIRTFRTKTLTRYITIFDGALAGTWHAWVGTVASPLTINALAACTNSYEYDCCDRRTVVDAPSIALNHRRQLPEYHSPILRTQKVLLPAALRAVAPLSSTPARWQ